MLVQWGITAAGLLVVALLLGVAVVDIYFEYHHRRTVGDRLRSWAGQQPMLAAAVALLLGAMIGHFFWRTP